ncbi:MAG: hypothetical protein ACFFD4_10685 [Candidatus Odinarchaeota archaeon]
MALEDTDFTEREVKCPWCDRVATTIVVSGTLKIACNKCGMQAFVTKLPSGTKINQYVSRRTIS